MCICGSFLFQSPGNSLLCAPTFAHSFARILTKSKQTNKTNAWGKIPHSVFSIKMKNLRRGPFTYYQIAIASRVPRIPFRLVEFWQSLNLQLKLLVKDANPIQPKVECRGQNASLFRLTAFRDLLLSQHRCIALFMGCWHRGSPPEFSWSVSSCSIAGCPCDLPLLLGGPS